MLRSLDLGLDRAGGALRRPPDEGEICALEGAIAAVIGELGGEVLMGEIRLRDDHQPGRTLVEPVHDARPNDAADPGEPGTAMGDEGIDERARLVAGGRVNDEASGLVEDDEILVLVDDVERDALCARGRGRGGGTVSSTRWPDAHGESRIIDDAAIDARMTRRDEGLDARAGQRADARGQEAIEAIARLGREGQRASLRRFGDGASGSATGAAIPLMSRIAASSDRRKFHLDGRLIPRYETRALDAPFV